MVNNTQSCLLGKLKAKGISGRSQPSEVDEKPDVPRDNDESSVLKSCENVLEPKVQAPYKASVNQAPREVIIERKKRLYASKPISTLIKPGSIELRSTESGINLAEFDDTEYDARPHSEWLSALRQGVRIPCQFFENLDTQWRRGLVVEMSEDGKNLRVLKDVPDRKEEGSPTALDEENDSIWLPRLQVGI